VQRAVEMATPKFWTFHFDNKCCCRTDEHTQDRKPNVPVREQEHNSGDVDRMERTPGQSPARGNPKPQEAWNYDPRDEQSHRQLN